MTLSSGELFCSAVVCNERLCMPPWSRLTTCCWCTNCSREPRQRSRALPIPPEEGEEYLSIALDWRSNTERPVQGLSEQQRSIGRDSRSVLFHPSYTECLICSSERYFTPGCFGGCLRIDTFVVGTWWARALARNDDRPSNRESNFGHGGSFRLQVDLRV